jgi:myo-inositol-1(or 4)-monophosphatase
MEKYKFTLELIKKAGELLLKKREEKFKVMIKNNNPRDIVTSVDLEINDFIAKSIKKKFPLDSIYSEEGCDKNCIKNYWSVDPIDGSSNFSRAIPHFAISIGYIKNNEPFLGAVYNPVTKELFSFKKNKGAFLNNKKIKISEETDLKKAYVFLHAGRSEEVQKWGGKSYTKLLENANKTSNYACSSLDICFVAAGRIEVNVYGTLSTLDIAPAIGILREAGGLIFGDKKEFVELSREPKKIYTVNNRAMLNKIKKII